jgi:hypothetical protein
MADEIKPQASHRLLETEFLRRPIDIGPAMRRAAIEKYWLEKMSTPAGEEEQQK